MRNSTPPLKEYFAILGLTESANLEDVKKAYRKKSNPQKSRNYVMKWKGEKSI